MGRISTSLIALLLLGCQPAVARGPVPIRPLDQDEFVPVVVSSSSVPVIYEPAEHRARRPPPQRREIQAPLGIEKRPSVAQTQTSRGSSIRGQASWYCRAGISICHHAYPPGSMVAAACGKLRRAMGSSWRGDTVSVRHGSRTIKVKLVDWCGSTSKLIDLYWEPMRRLGGSGVLSVQVSW
jgi:hypothetical protein